MLPPDEPSSPGSAAEGLSRTEELGRRTLRDLEWDILLENVAEECVTAPGRRWVQALRPFSDEVAARRSWTLTAEVLELADRGAELPPLSVPDVVPAVEHAARGGVLSGAELDRVRLGLRAVARLVGFLGEHREHAPTLAEHLSTDPTLREIREELERCVEEGGAVADSASPQLEQARRGLGQLRQRIRTRLGELIGLYREALQDGFIAERDGRYVLPVRADAPFRVHGVVLGSSASGATLYIEPQEVAELGNRLKVAEAEAEHQEAIVLARLSESLALRADALLTALEACAQADGLQAIERYARRVGARMLTWGEPGALALRAARHPLLALQGVPVVANDLALRGGTGLVFSGPNAGGKTVALKCLGLAALAQASGLPFPAEPESRCGFFQAVFSDIGDDQSLARSLSTFSGHIEAVRAMVERAQPGVLLLLDELAGGTDPEEGAALAVALLEALVRRGAAVAVTTHYERLKEAASESEHLENAAVGFDFERLQPTFRLEMGRPGASSALSVAERHGLPAAILERASRLLPELSRRRERILLELESKQVELDQLRRELEEEKARYADLTRELERERERLDEEQRADLGRAGRELAHAVREARAKVHEAVRRLGQIQDRQDLRQVERAIDEAARLVAVGGEVDRRTRTARPGLSPSARLQVGQRVRVQGMNAVAEVIEPPHKGQVRVLAGIMKWTVPVEQLELVQGGASSRSSGAVSSPSSRRTKEPTQIPPTPAVAPRTRDVTLDLRGERLEPALERLDEFMDLLLRRGEQVGYVLHGHGTGALKEAVRAHLRNSSWVGASRPAERDEGGDAFTVFWLQE